MREAGCELLVDAHEVAVVGLVEVLKHLPQIRRRFRNLVETARQRRPKAAVLIDFPDFNLRLARELHRMGIPVFYFVSPQVWAWRSGRVKQIRKHVRKMIVIFPFEHTFYRERGVEVSYVGHPLAYSRAPVESRAEAAKSLGLDPDKHWIGILPGSRRKEVELNLPEMLNAARLLSAHAGYEFVLPVASTLSLNWMKSQLSTAGPKVTAVPGTQRILPHLRAAVVASGTATVETAIAGVPMVVVYRLTGLTWVLGRRLVRIDTFAMPNLIAGRRIVRELIQRDFTAENVAREISQLIPEGPPRREMIAALEEVRQKLRDSGSAEAPAVRAAREIMESLAAPVESAL